VKTTSLSFLFDEESTPLSLRVNVNLTVYGFLSEERAMIIVRSHVDFSNSLIIHQVETKEIMTVTVFVYLILIGINFNDFYVTVKNVKCSAVCCIVKSLLSVWKWGQTWSFVFDILHEVNILLLYK